MYNKLSLTKPDLTNCIYDSDDIETLKHYLFKGFTVLQVNPDNDLENYVSDYYNINYDNAKYFDFLTKGNYEIISLIKILIEVKNMFKVENLMFAYYDNERYDLEFTNGWIKNIPASEHEIASIDEWYLDDQGNIDKAFEQGEIEMKYYVNDLTNVLEFDGSDFNLEQDENGIYCLGTDMYEWLVELDNAIYTLEDNNVNTLPLRANEYQDYIDLAKRTELENKILTYIDNMDEEIRSALYDVYEESNGNLRFVDSGMAYDGYDNDAKEIAQVEDGKIINLY